MAANEQALVGSEEPEWLRLYGIDAPAALVVKAWLEALGPVDREDANADPHSARTVLRLAIVDSRETSRAVRADATAGWKYTGSIIRALDEALGLAPARPTALFGQKGEDLHTPKEVLEGDGGRTGTIGLYWSDIEGANRLDIMRLSGITHRLNVASECIRVLAPSEDVVTVTIPMIDVQHEQQHAGHADDMQQVIEIWVEQLKECMELLRKWREDGAVVNVNCQMGKNRSGAVIVAWLCLERGWDLLTTVDHLRKVSSLSLGNPHLNIALAHLLDRDDIDIPLNPADDGGNWVTFSPVESPTLRSPAESAVRAEAMSATDVGREAARRLEALGFGQGGGEEESADGIDGMADFADLLDEV